MGEKISAIIVLAVMFASFWLLLGHGIPDHMAQIETRNAKLWEERR